MFCKNCWANLPDGTEQCSKCGLDPRVAHEVSDETLEASKGRQPLPEWLGNSSVPGASSSVQRGPGSPARKVTLKGEPSRKDPLVRIVFTAAMLIVIAGAVYFYHTTTKTIRSQKAGKAVAAGAGNARQGLDVSQPRPVIADLSLKISRDDTGYARDFYAGGAAFQAGNYRDAVFYFKEAYKAAGAEDEDLDMIKISLARSLTALGWKVYAEKDYQGALDYFDEANGHYTEAASLKGYGYAQASLENYGEAIESFTLVLREFGPDADVRKALKVLYLRLAEQELSGSRTSSSLRLMEQARNLDPADEKLKNRLEGIKRESDREEGFSERRGSRFNVKFEGGENAVSGHVIAILLEEAYRVVGAELSYYPDKPISAVLYSKEVFRDITRSPAWAGALYDGRIKIPVGGITEKTDKLEAVLFHEYTHAVVHRISGGRAPTWLNEGLAQYLENKREEDYATLLAAVALAGGVRLNRLEGSFMRLDQQNAAVAYSVSLSATEYIIREYGVYACRRILEQLGSGKDMDEAVNNILFISYEELQDGWQRYFNRKFSA